eukprot:739736-Pleurochrysis_carterae.AAC.2
MVSTEPQASTMAYGGCCICKGKEHMLIHSGHRLGSALSHRAKARLPQHVLPCTVACKIWCHCKCCGAWMVLDAAFKSKDAIYSHMWAPKLANPRSWHTEGEQVQSTKKTYRLSSDHRRRRSIIRKDGTMQASKYSRMMMYRLWRIENYCAARSSRVYTIHQTQVIRVSYISRYALC